LIIRNLWPEYLSKELSRLNIINEIWFQKYKNNQEIKSGTQGLRDSKIKLQ
jgi:hypothetical protein